MTILEIENALNKTIEKYMPDFKPKPGFMDQMVCSLWWYDATLEIKFIRPEDFWLTRMDAKWQTKKENK